MAQFAAYISRRLCNPRLIFPRINGPDVSLFYPGQAGLAGGQTRRKQMNDKVFSICWTGMDDGSERSRAHMMWRNSARLFCLLVYSLKGFPLRNIDHWPQRDASLRYCFQLCWGGGARGGSVGDAIWYPNPTMFIPSQVSRKWAVVPGAVARTWATGLEHCTDSA